MSYNLTYMWTLETNKQNKTEIDLQIPPKAGDCQRGGHQGMGGKFRVNFLSLAYSPQTWLIHNLLAVQQTICRMTEGVSSIV